MDPQKKPSWTARLVFLVLLLPLAYGIYKGVIWLMSIAFSKGGIPIP